MFLFSALDLVPDAEKHALFYSVVQAICYIFCFKHRSLLSTEAEREQIKQLNFERIIHSSLNPLKVRCSLLESRFSLLCCIC